MLILLFVSSWSRIFTISQDFWACVETSVSIFVVLELDDRILPLLKEDIKRKCRRSLIKRGLSFKGDEARQELERAAATSITSGSEFALHGFCMLYFFVLACMGVYDVFLYTCT